MSDQTVLTEPVDSLHETWLATLNGWNTVKFLTVLEGCCVSNEIHRPVPCGVISTSRLAGVSDRNVEIRYEQKQLTRYRGVSRGGAQFLNAVPGEPSEHIMHG